MVPAMTKNEDMYKNRVCPKGWTIKQKSASLKLPGNVVTLPESLCLASYYFIVQQAKIQFPDRLLDQ